MCCVIVIVLDSYVSAFVSLSVSLSLFMGVVLPAFLLPQQLISELQGSEFRLNDSKKSREGRNRKVQWHKFRILENADQRLSL